MAVEVLIVEEPLGLTHLAYAVSVSYRTQALPFTWYGIQARWKAFMLM